MFKDRKDAGRKLAAVLQKYKDTDTLVLAIPRGGVEHWYNVSDAEVLSLIGNCKT
jgi:putative phosphoribosyl transferase